MNRTLAFLSIFLIFSSALTDNCFAPLGWWGPVCTSSVRFAGFRGAYVNYHIIASDPSAQVYCYGLGISEYTSGAVCAWRGVNLGQINGRYVSAVWDNANANPQIQCYALGKSTNLTWTITTGQGQFSCIRAHKKLFARVSVDEGAQLIQDV